MDHSASCIDRAADILRLSGDLDGLTARQQYAAAVDSLVSRDVDCEIGCPADTDDDDDRDEDGDPYAFAPGTLLPAPTCGHADTLPHAADCDHVCTAEGCGNCVGSAIEVAKGIAARATAGGVTTMTRQTDTRTEYAVRIRTSLGTIRTEYRMTREDAEALRDRFDVVTIEPVTRTLDY